MGILNFKNLYAPATNRTHLIIVLGITSLFGAYRFYSSSSYSKGGTSQRSSKVSYQDEENYQNSRGSKYDFDNSSKDDINNSEDYELKRNSNKSYGSDSNINSNQKSLLDDIQESTNALIKPNPTKKNSELEQIEKELGLKK